MTVVVRPIYVGLDGKKIFVLIIVELNLFESPSNPGFLMSCLNLVMEVQLSARRRISMGESIAV